LSEVVWLSLAALTTAGAADMVSVFIRHNLIQFATPDDMRGRVLAVHGVFTGGSGQLGEFESGAVAEFIGPVGSVVVGGGGTIAVALIFARYFPKLRRVDMLEADHVMEASEKAAVEAAKA
ncbi:MAG: MFS transporter, partial [Pseudomonadota bacterium]|nr:MFS transporter [Pseudomonadota bacterium]